MIVGGGLYDRDPEPDRYQAQTKITPKFREWAFWAILVFGLWVAFQGQYITVFWFVAVIAIVCSVLVLGREIRRQWREHRS